MLVHVLKHVLDANQLAVAYRPDTVELQSLDDGTLQNEHGCCTRAADEVDTLGMEIGNRLGEHRVMMARQQTNAVGTYQRGTIAIAGVENALFERSSLLGLLAKAGRDDDEGTHTLLSCQQVDRVGTHLGRDHQDGQLRGGQFACIVKDLDTLHFVFLGVYNAQGSIVSTADNVSYDSTTRLMYVVRAANDDYTVRL